MKTMHLKNMTVSKEEKLRVLPGNAQKQEVANTFAQTGNDETLESP